MKSRIGFKEKYAFLLALSSTGGDVYDDAIEIAYSTLRRTISGIAKNPYHDKIAQEKTLFLKDQLQNISVDDQDKFDVWHRETTQGIIQIYEKYGQHFTVGQAQKLINMTIKRLFLADEKLVELFYDFAHIPIDGIILRGIKSNLVSEEMQKINISFRSGKRKIAWSKIDDYEAYLDFQKNIRKFCGEIPLDFEFRLWLAQKEREK